MTKLEAGDYLLPSNDGETVYRLRRYRDGRSGGLEMDGDYDFWSVWEWTRTPESVDPDDERGWMEVEQQLRTRREAEQAALGR